VRVLFATTANDGHFGPLLPFARAFADVGHEVAVAAPLSYSTALERAGFAHRPFADVPEELIGPIMARLPELPYEEADEIVIREVFARVDAQAALPGLTATMRSWRPDVVVRESAELASLVAAEHAGVPHVHVCIGMHEVLTRFTEVTAEPLEELGRMAGLSGGRAASSLAAEMVLSSVPERLDRVVGAAEVTRFHRYHEPVPQAGGDLPATSLDPDAPLVYVTFGSVTGSLPPFATVFRDALDALADLDATVLMTVGRRLDPESLRPWPDNSHVEQWWPQDDILARASAMVGHGGFGTTMGALAAGVPQVVVPMFSFDQLVNAEHVAAIGAGIALPAGPDSVAHSGNAVSHLLADPSYAAQARAVASDIAALPHPREAVVLLESLIG
jgi:UDP:flavonoid glycosyltransferase YjiC (YdhE family)